MEEINSYWSIIPNNQLIEIAAIAGFKSVILDMEHGSYDWSSLVNAVAIGKSKGMQVLIRPASKDPREILSCLETGADGLMIPHISTIEEVLAIKNASFYPPLGKRGASGFTRATGYGQEEFGKHMKNTNTKLFLGLLIESVEGLTNLNDIAYLGDISCLYFGTYDIALSMGISDQRDPKIKEAVTMAINQIEGKVPYIGQVAVNKEQREELDTRINFIANGVDCGIILDSFKSRIL